MKTAQPLNDLIDAAPGTYAFLTLGDVVKKGWRYRARFPPSGYRTPTYLKSSDSSSPARPLQRGARCCVGSSNPKVSRFSMSWPWNLAMCGLAA